MRALHAIVALTALALLAGGCVDSRPRGDAGAPPSDSGAMSDASLPDDDAGPAPVDAGPAFPPGTTCTPGYACPPGGRFEYLAGLGRCVWDVELPATSGVEPYCDYFAEGYFGFYWPLPSADPAYTCPAQFRDAPNAELGYCLYEDFAAPPGATPDCGALLASGEIGFRWTCP